MLSGPISCIITVFKKQMFIINLLLCLLVFSTTAYAEMITGTLRPDTFFIAPGTACEGVRSLLGGDTVTVESGALVINEVHDTGWLVADSDVIGIDTGLGDDHVINNGTIAMNATAVIPVDPLANRAMAESVGIMTGPGDDVVENNARIQVTAQAEINMDGLSEDSNALARYVTDLIDTLSGNDENTIIDKTIATAVGVAGEDGNQSIDNSGAIEVGAVSLQSAGSLVNTAGADAKGIKTGDGDDTITGSGDIQTTATADIQHTEITSNTFIAAMAVNKSRAFADAGGIVSGAGADTIENSGSITSRSSADVSIPDMSAEGAVFSASFGISASEASALGISGEAGHDDITNTGEILAISTADTASTGFSGTLTGLAGATAVSSADAESTGIDGGAGDDYIVNSGAITATANADAESTAISISGADVVSVIIPTGWDGVTTARANATGISGGIGNDEIDNQGDINLTASAHTHSSSTAVTPIGAAIALSKSTARAGAKGIDLGTFNNTLTNSGTITAGADASAKAVSVSVSGAGASLSDATLWSGGTTARSDAAGISADAGSGSIFNQGDLIITSDAETDSENVAITILGIAASNSRANAASSATGIDAGLSDSEILNIGNITTDAEATADTTSVSVSLGGAAISSGGLWNGGAQANADAAGIRAGSGDHDVVNSGYLDTDARAETTSTSVAGSVVGVSAALSTSEAEARATGIEASLNTGNIVNTGKIDSYAEADAHSVNVSLTGAGMAVSADAGLSAKAEALGIANGFRENVIRNQSEIFTHTVSRADTVKVAVSGIGGALTADSVFDGGATAEALSTGIDAGWGGDSVFNEADVTATSFAATGSTNVSVAVAGLASSISASSANAQSIGVDGNLGCDTITNTGNLTAKATSMADAVTVDVTGIGVSMEVDSVWNGGTTADSFARGIEGGGGNDTILTTSGLISSDALSTAHAVSVDVTGIGGTFSADNTLWDTGTTSNAFSAGISGGNGNDSIDVMAEIRSHAGANTHASATAVGFAGVTASVQTSASYALATGIDGGDGKDEMVNQNKITADAFAVTHARNVNVTLAGAGMIYADASANAEARGIDGGDDADHIENDGDLNVSAESVMNAKGTSVVLAGANVSKAETTSEASVTGIYGGRGEDDIINSGHIIADANAEALAGNVDVTLAGAAAGSAGTQASATAKGIDGGGDNDTIVNLGQVDITTIASTDASGTTVMLAGASATEINMAAQTSATGIDGGSGDDLITNDGDINIQNFKPDETVPNTLKVVSVNLVGANISDAGIQMRTTARGMDGGENNDIITNTGDINIDIDTTIASQSSANMIFGGNKSIAAIDATTSAMGIDGGDGDDVIDNTGSIRIYSNAELEMKNNTFTFGGTASQQGTILANAETLGIQGGQGSDEIRNNREITANSTSVFTVSGQTDVGFGSGNAGARVGTDALSTGIDGGDGDNVIDNNASIHVTSHAEGDFGANSFTFGGGSSNRGNLTILARGDGIMAGKDNDVIRNSDSLNVNITGTLVSSGDSDVAFGSSGNAVTVGTETRAGGVDAGDGENRIENHAALNVTAESTIGLTAKSFAFGGTADNAGQALARADASGISGGNGADTVLNSGNIFVKASGSAAASGVSGTVFGDNEAVVTIRSQATARGFDLGDGDNHVVTDAGSSLTVSATATAVSGTSSEVGWFSDGKSRSKSSSRSEAVGIRAGQGENIIENNGSLHVSVQNLFPFDALARAVSNGDFLDWIDGNAHAETSSAATATATGIEVGSGSNIILNTGLVNVTATPNAMAFSDANGQGADGDGKALAESTANAWATGIKAGHGSNWITNSGTITVTARPTALAQTIADGDGLWPFAGDATSKANTSVTAQAAGILTGNGNNEIINNGTITATITPRYGASASATVDWPTGGSRTIVQDAIDNGSYAVGIQTGNGNDLIINNGSITTELSTFIYNIPQTGISSGGGDDEVILGDGSTVAGDIDLGSGNDAITFMDSGSVAGASDFIPGMNISVPGMNSVDGGTGTDTVIFSGQGSNNTQLVHFEAAVKNRPGTYTVGTLPQMRSIAVADGTLHIQSSYYMPASGTFQATLSSAAEYGRLDVGGTAGLDGSLKVVRDTGAFSDGDTFNILTAGRITGDFTGKTLPEPTELVSFYLNQDNQKVQVVASVDDFTTMAHDPAETAIAEYLDELVPTAEGDLSNAIGAVQMLNKSDFQTAFASLSPAVYAMSTRSTLTGVRQYTRTIQNRLVTARTIEKDAARESKLLLAFNGKGIAQFADSEAERPTFNIWADAFGQTGTQDDVSGFSGYDVTMKGLAVGMDYSLVGIAMADHFVAGLSVGYAGTDIESNDDLGESEIKHLTFSAYSSYELRNFYAEGVLSYGRNSYDHTRHIVIGQPVADATSSHDGNVYAATTAGGYYFRKGPWSFVPFTGLSFTVVDETEFEVTGSGGYDLAFDDRETLSLTMDMGIKASRLFDAGNYRFIPEVSLAWNHDFDIDDRTITARFKEAQGTSFTMEGPETPKNGVITGAGLHIITGSAFSGAIFYNGEFREDYTMHGIMGKVQYMFD